MKTKLVAIIFTLVIVALGVFFYISRNREKPEVTVSKQAKIINPKYTNASQSGTQSEEDGFESESFTSLIDLMPTETLISTLAGDLDNDTYDDQIVVVRKADSRYLFIVVGIYNTETKNYERVEDIDTGISKTGTFAYSVLDVIGNHTQALVYQGYDDKDDYILNIHLCNGSGSDTKLVNIGSFKADGTVFVQQTERAESYELGISNGESFSVWVYSSDKKTDDDASYSSNQNTDLNQIQTEYKWNSSTQRYEFNRSTTVSAGHLAAKELSRIQDGTVETFADFMEGLWYKTSNVDNTIRYLYFDYANKEVIFLSDDTEGSYVWEDSKLRQNGIFLTTSNSIISSLARRFLITLISVDEISVSVRDEISMNISESSLWDGTYKKTSSSYSFGNESYASILQGFRQKIISKSWMSSDQTIKIDFDETKYIARIGEMEESGIYSIFRIVDDFVIQFRPLSDYVVLEKEYKMTFGIKIIEDTVNKKTVEKMVADEDALIFTPVMVTPTEVFSADGKVIDFKSL